MALLASDEASRFGDYNWESDFEYLFSFHSLVVGKVAVLLVVTVKVDTVLEDVNGKVASTSVAVVTVATALEVVRLVAGTRRGLRTEAFTGTSDHLDCCS